VLVQSRAKAYASLETKLNDMAETGYLESWMARKGENNNVHDVSDIPRGLHELRKEVAR